MEHIYNDSIPTVSHSPQNWFLLDTADILAISEELLGEDPRHYIRHEQSPAPNQKFIVGVNAARIESELRTLSEDCLQLIDSSKEHVSAIIVAAAIYHLRFEAIHPLRDGNGRVGRFVMASQCNKFLTKPSTDEIIRGLEDNKTVYRSLFIADIPDLNRVELLVDILIRVTGINMHNPKIPDNIDIIPKHCKRISTCFRFGPDH